MQIFNLCITYPLNIYPTNTVIESYLFKGWPKSWKRKWSKNIFRVIVVAATVVLTCSLKRMDKLQSLNGALCCTPIAFILPTLFHYKITKK